MEAKGKRRKDNRRDRILDAAAYCFSRTGYEGTPVRDISTAAGILPGSIYYHFASKEELLGAVHDEGNGRHRARERSVGAPRSGVYGAS